MAEVTYTLIFKNNSSNRANVCVYQTDPDLSIPNVMSLAWFSKYAAPGTVITFQWKINYNFVWAETGTLAPGVVFAAGQQPSADLSTTNAITFTNVGGAYEFVNQTAGPKQGTLTIREDKNIPMKMASVGIGMSGVGTFVVQAQPNWNLNFTPHPLYWITFGDYTKGQVLDIGSISDKAEISFPENLYSMTAILKSNNSWDVQPTSAVNARFIAAREGASSQPSQLSQAQQQQPQTARRSGAAVWGDSD